MSGSILLKTCITEEKLGQCSKSEIYLQFFTFTEST